MTRKLASHRFAFLVALLVVIVVAAWSGGDRALAQPAPPSGDKLDAKALMQTGVRLIDAKDYLGALAIFKDAYARFPSAKILLNIGTTLRLLDRRADAANAYQRYLDSGDADPAKKSEVAAVIAELDKSVGYLEITVTPPEAEVQINSEDWIPAKQVARYRVNQGQFTVTARLDKYQTEAKSAQIAVGEKAAISIAMTPLPQDTNNVGGGTTTTGGNGHSLGGTSGGSVTTTVEPEPELSRVGGYVVAHVDLHPDHPGGAALIGAVGHLTARLQVRAAAIVGPTFGGFIGSAFTFLPGNLRPFAAVGFPVFVSDGPRVGFRGAGGVEVQLTRNLSLIGELGIEYPLSYEPPKQHTLIIPALGATGRL